MGRREQIDWIGSMKMEPGEPNSDTGNESSDADDALINRISFRGQNPNQMEMLWSQLGPFLQILWNSWRLLQSFLTHGIFQGILKFFFFFLLSWIFIGVAVFKHLDIFTVAESFIDPGENAEIIAAVLSAFHFKYNLYLQKIQESRKK